MNRIIHIALRTKERKATLRHALRNASDARRKQLFDLLIRRPNRQVRDAIRTGQFFRRHGLHPVAVYALEKLRPIFQTYAHRYKPAENNIYYDIKQSPQTHAAAFFQMAHFLQERGERIFQCFPLRHSFVPAHITLDTKALCNTFMHKRYNPKQEKHEVWSQFLNLSSKAVRSQKASDFTFTIQTDGVSITILKADTDKPKKRNRRKPKGYKEFQYVTDLTAAELAEIADNCVYFDPGRRDILHGIYNDSEPNAPKRKRYTSSQRANEIRLHRHQRLRQQVKAKYRDGIVQTMENLLAEGAQCTMTYPCEYVEYVTKWAQAFPVLNDFYARYRTRHKSEYWPEGQPFHRRLRSCTFQQQLQADQRLIKSIIGGRDPKPAVILGNWSAPMTHYHEPIRGIGMRRMMRRHKLKVVLIDEYRTSKTCPACDGLIKRFIHVPNPRPFRAKKRAEVWCNGLLRCMSKECIAWVTQNSSRKAREPEWIADGRYWNRDTAAVLNFRRMVRSLIATRSIPAPFRRNGGSTPGANDDTPATNDGTGSDDDDVAAQAQHRYPTRRRTGRNGGGTPATNDDTPAAGNGTGSDDDDVAAQAQHRYPTRRRTGRNGGSTPGANDDTPAAGNGSGSDDDDVAAQAQHRYPTRRRTGRNGDDTPAAGNGTGSDDDDVAAQAQHRYPTRRRTGRAPADNAQQQ
ncbi:hypothetical protein LPJ81_004902 [Coemansia sp. IMI 209127]|nr:hypothetical protein LPJ81_004902 [Coemansia sp. IMI 209127]